MQLFMRCQRPVPGNTSPATSSTCQFELSMACKKLCHLNGQLKVQMPSSMFHHGWLKTDQTVSIRKQRPGLIYLLPGNGQCD
jgi:hypothetical protein